MKKFLNLVLILNLIFALFAGVLNFTKNPEIAKAYDWNTNNLASDGGFVNINGANVAAIQQILNSTGGALASYSEGGRSAAQIIYDAAHGINMPGDSGGWWPTSSNQKFYIDSSTGTINPIAILAMLQKEQSLIYAKSLSEGALNAAMGMGCPDSGGCNPTYRGFTNQVNWGAAQLRWNYQRAQGQGYSDYQVGQTQIIDDVAVTFGNRTTSALYRYTPHLGTNFSRYFEQWGGNSGLYVGTWVSQSAYPTVTNGATQTMTISYRNTGASTWTKGVVNLGIVDRSYHWINSYDMAYNWISSNRPAYLNENSVAPGEIGTFTFTIKNDNDSAGNHRLDVGLVADGITWFNEGTHAYWDVTVPTAPPAYQASWVSQSAYPTVTNGATQTMTISYRNTGSATWQKGIVNLGLVDTNFNPKWGYDMLSAWVWFDRPAKLNESSVAPGEIGTFTFSIRNNNASSGNHRLDVGLVADGITWFNRGTHAYWDVTVPTAPPAYQAAWVSQSAYPTVTNGATQTMTISYRNTGSATWQKGIVNLGTVNTDFSGRISSYDMAYNWVSGNRPAFLSEDTVAPGEIGTFTFTIKNDNDSVGNHRLDTALVADGITWFNRGTHAYWDVIVP